MVRTAAPARPKRQEQESARREVTEVAPGVLRLQLPANLPGLAHVNCYALLDARGAALVDPGLPGPAAQRALRDRLRSAGIEPRHVHTILVTHSHPDHFGGAAPLARTTQARVLAHRSFSFGGTPAQLPDEVSVDDLPRPAESPTESAVGGVRAAIRVPWDPGAGERAWMPRRKLSTTARRWTRPMDLVPPIHERIEAGARLRLAERDWIALHTPGHTPDHLCLHDPEHGVLLAGDHVLPTITPHISGLGRDLDPLGSYLASLAEIEELAGVKRVLPAHGHPFTDLGARAKAIAGHHRERLERLIAIGHRLGRASVEAYSRELFQERSWGPMAESETYAHLEHLRLQGRAAQSSEAGGRLLYEV
jgi:glyoxylase-like metal-dependent hydrolase (beta-lactamase superfamily II)